MPQNEYIIPAKPKSNEEFLEVIAKVIFLVRFNGDIVEERWPKIKKSFHNFDIHRVAGSSVDDFLGQPGVINNRTKISNIIENAKICELLIQERGSMQNWVDQVSSEYEKSIIFNPSLKEECKMFKGIGETTSGWLEYVFTKAKSKPQTIKRGESPP